jgi:tetratricopeptide (TPR) repeat protein
MPDDEAVKLLHRSLAEAEKSIKSGRYPEAREKLRASRALLQAAGWAAREHTYWLSLRARLAHATGRYGKAADHLVKALGLAERTWGPEHWWTGRLLAELAPACYLLQRWQEAEEYAARAEAVLSGRPDQWHHRASALLTLADCRRKRGPLAEAGPLVRRALDLIEREGGPGSPLLQVALDGLAKVCFQLGEPSRAEEAYKRQLRLCRRAPECFPGWKIGVYCNLAEAYRAQGRRAEMVQAVRRACRLWRRTEAAPAVVVAVCLDWVSVALLEVGQPRRAVRAARKAVWIKEKMLGPWHSSVSQSLHELGQAQAAAGDDAEAEQTYRRAMAIELRALGPQSPDHTVSLINLASLAARAGRAKEAERLLRQALTLREEMRGPAHEKTAAVRQHLVNLLRDQGRDEEAAELEARGAEAALAPNRGEDGPSPEEAPSAAELVSCYDRALAEATRAFKADDLPRAEVLLRDAAAAAGRLDPLDRRLAEALMFLARARERQGDPDEARRLARRAIVVLEKASGPDDDYAARAAAFLGDLLKGLGFVAEAEACFRRALRSGRHLPGPGQLSSFRVAREVMIICERRGALAEAEEFGRRAQAAAGQLTGHEGEIGHLCFWLATLAARQGRPADAAPLACRAVQLGRGAPAFPVESWRDLAELCGRLGEAEASERAWQCCVAGLERERGPAHLDLLPALGRWAEAAGRLGQARQAAEIAGRRLEIADASLRPDDPGLVECLRGYIDFCAELRDADAAERACQAVLARVGGSLGEAHARVADCLEVYAAALRRLRNCFYAGLMEQRARAIRSGLSEAPAVVRQQERGR